LADLNQAIAAAASLNTPFAYFNVADSSVPGNPYLHTPNGTGTTIANDKVTDTVIVDHSSANTGTTFVPGQDAFIVLVGSTTAAPTAPTISSAGHIAA
jgi:hypothetical protein